MLSNQTNFNCKRGRFLLHSDWIVSFLPMPIKNIRPLKSSFFIRLEPLACYKRENLDTKVRKDHTQTKGCHWRERVDRLRLLLLLRKGFDHTDEKAGTWDDKRLLQLLLLLLLLLLRQKLKMDRYKLKIFLLTKNIFFKPARVYFIFKNTCSETMNILPKGPRKLASPEVRQPFHIPINFQHLKFRHFQFMNFSK